MQFIHYDLGQRQGGEILEITLIRGANVRLMDNSNFHSYKIGHPHRYIGGLAKKSPVRLQIPRSGHWHVAVDMQGLRGSTRAYVRIVPGALHEIQERLLREVPSLVKDDIPPPTDRGVATHDVFSESQSTTVLLFTLVFSLFFLILHACQRLEPEGLLIVNTFYIYGITDTSALAGGRSFMTEGRRSLSAEYAGTFRTILLSQTATLRMVTERAILTATLLV
jgi:hypothetical protein